MTSRTDNHTTPNDVHDLAAPYALHALEADEVETFERHLSGCQRCQQEVASFEATTARLAEASAVDPPEQVRANVLGAITDIRQDPPPATHDDQSAAVGSPDDATPSTIDESAHRETTATRPPAGERTGRVRSLASRLGLGLAAALLVVAGALGVWATSLRGQLRDQQQRATQVAAVLSADDARTVHHDGASLVVDPDDNLAVFASHSLPDLPSDQVLQLWVINEDGARSAGLLEDPTQPRLLDLPVEAGVTVGITVEPAGGSDQPTSDPIWAAET